MITTDQIIEAIVESGSALAENVDILKGGEIRVATEFIYPDGARVDVFICKDGDKLRLTDMGNTETLVGHLGMTITHPGRLSASSRQYADQFRVIISGDEIYAGAKSTDEIIDACRRVAIVCMTVHCLALGQSRKTAG